MDHRGLRARLAGAGCTSCGAAVPVERIEVLADRGDVAFVELDCAGCGSRTMSLVLRNELDTATEARMAGGPPLDEDDVAAMGRFLAGWHGDMRSLLAADRDARPGDGA